MSLTGVCDPVRRLADLKARLAALLGQERIANDYVRFRISLAEEQSKVLQQSAGAFTDTQPSLVEPYLGALDAGSLVPRRELLDTYFAGICKTVSRHGKGSEDLNRLYQAVAKDVVQLEDIVRLAGIRTQREPVVRLSEELSISRDLLQFIAHTLASPFVAARRLQWVPGAAQQTHQAGICPFCGSAAALAKLRRDDGKRSLFCSLCGLEWEFRRLGCPSCANEEQAKLDTLFVDQASYCWVETCERCMTYIKTFDERRRDETWKLDPYVEDTATLYWDLVAEREGYHRSFAFTAAC